MNAPGALVALAVASMSALAACSRSDDKAASAPATSTSPSAVPSAIASTAPGASHSGGAAGTGGCPAGQVLSQLTTGPRCMRTCGKSSDCGKGWDCASAPLAGAAGKMARVCFNENEN